MSSELDSLPPSRNQHRKKSGKDVEKSEKKRKRNTAEEADFGLASPKKKRKSSQQTKTPGSQSKPIAATPAEVVSPFYQQTSSFYLPLPPISQKHALQGICAEHISPLILTYYPPLHGVIISYANPRLSSDPQSEISEPAYARSIDEYAASFVWFTADFLVFKPQRNSVIEGYVNLQSESTIGLLCFNFFNASIERRRLPKEWRWMSGGMRFSGRKKLKKAGGESRLNSDRAEAEESDAVEQILDDADGYFQDRVGKKVEGLLRFRVKNVDTSKSIDRESGFVSIEGTMLSEEEEAQLQQEEKERRSTIGRKQLARQNEPSHAATVNGFNGSMDIGDTPSPKQRTRY